MSTDPWHFHFRGSQKIGDCLIDHGGLFHGREVAGLGDYREGGVWDGCLHGLGDCGRCDCVFFADDDQRGQRERGQQLRLVAAIGHGVLRGDDRLRTLIGHVGLGQLPDGGIGGFSQQAGGHGLNEFAGAGFSDVFDGLQPGGAGFGRIGFGPGVDE